MKLCQDNHHPVVFTTAVCPLCVQIATARSTFEACRVLTDKVEDLEGKIADLEYQLDKVNDEEQDD